MDTIRVVSTWRFDDAQLEQLHSAAPGLELQQVALRGQDILPHLRDAQVLVTHDLPFDLAQAPSLRWVQVPSAGVDHLLDHPIMSSHILLTNASGIHAVPIAEHVLAMMLSWSRQLGQARQRQSAADWRRYREAYSGAELYGATVGIIGYGSIGRQVGRLAAGLGMRVLAVRRSPGRSETGWCEPGIGDPTGAIPERIYGPCELGAILPQCDYVVIALPLTKETRSIIGSRELAAIKPSAYLVNISRGGVIDQNALIQALQDGTIAGVGLDVFATEPLPADSPLWAMENVTATPHVSGQSDRYSARLALLLADNLARFAMGKPLLNLVDKVRGY